jgi:phosphoserine phosphatase
VDGYGGRVPLLLVDLDNTLVDRAGAFERWARGFASEHAAASAAGGRRCGC